MTNAQPPVTIDNDTGTVFHEDSQEQMIEELFDTEANAEKTSGVIMSNGSFAGWYQKLQAALMP
jgi:hypothetical protein